MTKWSPYQEDIFNWIASDSKHLMVKAGAGCGKTTTIVELYQRIKLRDANASVLFLAFNKKIAEELQSRGVPASTMNSFGFKIVLRQFPKIKLETNKVRFLCRRHAIDYKLHGLVGRCVDLMKAYLLPIGVLPHYVEKIINDFGLSDEKVESHILQKIITVFGASLSDFCTIDFADQICYPIYHNISVQKYDYIIVDEAQDMSPNKLELVTRGVGKRFVCVGDPLQAIYGFAGADSESMDKIQHQFDPIVKDLPVTYRCGKKIVQHAHDRRVAPDKFQAGENNHDGNVSQISFSEFDTLVKPKDFVLCRMSAPLVSGCFKLIKKGIRAQILGRDVGKKLIDLVERINGDSDTSGDEMAGFSANFSNYKQRELSKLRAADKDTQADNLEDQLDCLWVFVEGCKTIFEINTKIEAMFDDAVSPYSVIFSTIHKAKGLEAERVFCLPYKARSSTNDKQRQEEKNLLYVQITRAKNELFWVKG